MSARKTQSSAPPAERAAIVSFVLQSTRNADPDALLDELAGLVHAAGAVAVLRATQTRATRDASTLIGSGRAEQLGRACAEADVTVVVFDNELSPAQARNLEEKLGRRVVDRTQLILDIFARRARTREGKLQVELAQLQYLLPRLVGSSAALSRLGGGIGTRGPGETKLETDRRRLRDRLAKLRREIADVQSRRGRLREQRERRDLPTVALVGYTNAGKSTLFNLLTGGDAVASEAMFATLDPLLRRARLPDARTMLISDTVGFIDRLPHQLVAAFHATLEEVASADLLLHVVDAAATDADRRDRAVRAVIEEVDAVEVPMLIVFNKCDLLPPDDLARLKIRHPDAAFVSARSGHGREDLLEIVASRLALDTERIHLQFNMGSDADRRQIAELYRHARVLSHVTIDDRVTMEVEAPRRLLDRLAHAKVSA